MEPEVIKELAEIRGLLRESVVHGRQLDLQMDRAERRLDRAEQRMEKFDQRFEKFDQRFETTRRLVEAGIKRMVTLATKVDRLEKTQRAFMDSLRKGGNGNGRKLT